MNIFDCNCSFICFNMLKIIYIAVSPTVDGQNLRNGFKYKISKNH